MHNLTSTTPIMGGSFTLTFRPAKRARSPSPQNALPEPKRICNPIINNKDNSTGITVEATPIPTPTPTPRTQTHQSKIDISSLNFPAMLLKKAKRKGLPIPSQFIHPGFFIRYLDRQHPEVDFTILEYKEAWYYGVELASKNVDLNHLTFMQPGVRKRKVEEEVRAACDLINNVRLKTRDEYAASKQAASVKWANVHSDSQRFHELLEEKRERKRRWREDKENEMELSLALGGFEMDDEFDAEDGGLGKGFVRRFDGCHL